MNRPFELLVRGASTNAAVDLKAVVGQRVTLSLPEETLLSMVNGIVARASRGMPEPGGVTRYEIHIRPAEWTLTKRMNSRIFQQQSATEIIEAILGEHRVTTKPAIFARRLSRREYCAQYDETDSAFAHRLLAEEGIAAYFDQAAGGRWTLVDDTTIQKPPAGSDFTVHANPANLKPGALAAIEWRTEHAVEVRAVARRDYDFRRPQHVLEHAAAPFDDPSPAEAALEEYTYEPDRLLRPEDDGQETARDLEAARALVEVAHLRTNFAAAAGTSVHVEGEDLSGDWFVIGADVHLQSSREADGKTAAHRTIWLTAIPLATPFRPAHVKRPRIFGTQSARVVGATPEGTIEGTVDVDDDDRVNVEMRWDRRDLWNRGAPGRECPTRRVRVVQAWAGPGYGFVTLPRIGDEVIIAYEDGNPDRPLVIGRVHNAVSRTPLVRSERGQTRSIWKSQSFGPNGPVEGNNFIYMDDEADAEVLGIKAQKDLTRDVGRHSITEIGGDESTVIDRDQMLVVLGSQKVWIGEGKNSSGGGGGGGGGSAVSTPGGQIVNVKGGYFLGAKTVYLGTKEQIDLDAGTNIKLNAAADLDEHSKNHQITAESNYLVEAPSVTIQGHTVVLSTTDGSSSIVLTSGRIEITSSGPVEVNGTPVKLNC